MIPHINSIDALRYHRSSMGPNWRVQLASSRPTRSFRRMNGLRDPTVRALQDYLGLTAKKGWAAARAEFPLIARAEDLEQDASRRGAARLMILAGAASEEMSERLGVSQPAIQIWESLYFDVRGLQHALAWLSTYVIRPEQAAGHAELAARLKVAATAGPEAARALLDGPPEVPGDETERLARRHLSLQTKLEEAVEMPVETNREKFQFVKYYGRLLMTRKRLELASARLAEKRAAAQRRHELAMQRLEPTRQAERSVQGQATDPGPRQAAAVRGDQERRESAKERRRASPRAVRLGPLHRRRPNGGRSPRSIPITRLQLRHHRSGGTPPCGGQRPSGPARRSRGRLSVTIAARGRARHKPASASSRCSRVHGELALTV